MPQTAWLELELDVPSSVADDVAALLVDAGALGAEQRPLEDPALQRILASFDGTSSPETAETTAREVLALLGVEAPATFTHRRRDDTDWAERWKEYFEPLQLGERLWIVPSWRSDFQPPAGATPLQMDPGMAFGTGQHATTALTWELLEAELTRAGDAVARERLLDVGCGTGVLAMGAAALGVDRLVAIDNDPEAVAIAAENATINGLAERLQVAETPLGELPGAFERVVANILAPTLIELADALVSHVAPGGVLYLSGLLATESQEVTEAITRAATACGRNDLAVVGERRRGDWVALRFGPQP